MRRFSSYCFIAFAMGSILPSCGTNTPPPTYVEATWQVRCLRFDGTPMPSGCSQPPVRSVYGYDGTDQLAVACSIRESGGVRTINFSAGGRGSDGVRYSIALTGAAIPAAGGTPSGGACTFSFTDGNLYTAPCGGLAPSPTQPCQVRDITFGTDMGSSTMRAQIYCIEAPASADPNIHRGVSQVGSGTGQELMPFPVTFYDYPVTAR